jgi:hypothetical protein
MGAEKRCPQGLARERELEKEILVQTETFSPGKWETKLQREKVRHQQQKLDLQKRRGTFQE